MASSLFFGLSAETVSILKDELGVETAPSSTCPSRDLDALELFSGKGHLSDALAAVSRQSASMFIRTRIQGWVMMRCCFMVLVCRFYQRTMYFEYASCGQGWDERGAHGHRSGPGHELA